MKLPKESFDPKLKAAMEEVKVILARYDCAASVILQSQKHIEHLLHVSPSWSCMTLENNQIRLKTALQTGDAAEKERGNLTIGMMMGFIDAASLLKSNFETLALMVGKKVGIEHVSRFSPHEDKDVDEGTGNPPGTNR